MFFCHNLQANLTDKTNIQTSDLTMSPGHITSGCTHWAKGQRVQGEKERCDNEKTGLKITYNELFFDKVELTFTSIFAFSAPWLWIILAFGQKLWLHMSIKGNIIGTFSLIPSECLSPRKRKALDDAADIAHPREAASMSWPRKGWSPGFMFETALLTCFSNSRRNRHLLFTCYTGKHL